MTESTDWTFAGTAGEIHARTWEAPADPRYIAVLFHGYGEHIGRYDHVAATLARHGAAVYGLDHMGHGSSEGEPAVVTGFDDVVADGDRLVSTAIDAWPDRPVVLIGHSMGGLIAARYAQLHGDRLTALVLSGPAVGRLDVVDGLLALDEIPDVPLDPAVLSRNPEIGAAYEADPLVWHGPFKRPMLEAFATTIADVNESGSVGDLPLLWVHGEDDQLVPIDGSRDGVDRLKGPRFRAHAYPEARHEVFNELNAEEVLSDVTSFIDDVLVGHAI